MKFAILNLPFAIRVSIGTALLAAVAQPAQAIDFFPSLDAAHAAHPADTRAQVLIFGSQTCGWCRKLAADTLASPLVEQSADCFLWIKIDVDEHEDLAARYGVRGLPHTAVVDEFGNVLGEQPGYMPAQEFVDFLMQSVTQPAPTIRETELLLAALEDSNADTRHAAVRKLIDQVSRVDAVGRDQTIQTLAGLDAPRWAEFVPYLEHPRLAIRATAHGLLTRASPADLPFDPFAPTAERAAQMQAWVSWMREHGGEVPRLELPLPPEESSAWPERKDEPPKPPVAQPIDAGSPAAE